MFETSQDILNISKTAAVAGLSVLFGILIYYMIRIVRQIFLMIKEMRDRINKVDEVVKAIKEKIEHSTSYLLLISEGMKKVLEVAKDYTNTEKKKNKTRR